MNSDRDRRNQENSYGEMEIRKLYMLKLLEQVRNSGEVELIPGRKMTTFQSNTPTKTFETLMEEIKLVVTEKTSFKNEKNNDY